MIPTAEAQEVVQVSVPPGTTPGSIIRAYPDASRPELAVEVAVPHDLDTRNGALLNVAMPAIVGQPVEHFEVQRPEEKRCCDSSCQKECGYFSCAYCFVVGIFTAFSAVLGAACLAFLALSPASVIWAFIEKWYKRYVTRCTLFDVAAEVLLLIIIPLTIAISILDYYLPMRDSCQASRSIPFWRYFFMAFIRAGLLEETLKYIAVRRLLFKEYVIDARCLIVYATWAGVVFGVIENITYAFILPLGAAVIRCLLTVPLHGSTGLNIGANIVSFRFQQPPSDDLALIPSQNDVQYKGGFFYHLRTYIVSTWLAIVVHGIYNVMLFIASGECGALYSLIAVSYLGIIPWMTYVRKRLVQIQQRYPADNRDVHQLIEEGTIRPPCQCCCCGNGCCSCCY
mmetsp:Transcript_3175/g.4869  ORF Transcript_3175/g.4869 Transcript_3175/m.4869 type:complete len:397 (+) Transcript_3175:41-1231(+)